MTNNFQKLKIAARLATALIILTACTGDINMGKISDAGAERLFGNNKLEFERDKLNLQLVHNCKCHGLELKAYAPKTLPLRNIQLPDHQLPDDYDQGNIYLSIAGDPKADVTISNVLGTDWAIFDSNGGFLSFPQLDPGHIQRDRTPTTVSGEVFKSIPAFLYYQSTEVFSLYTNSKNLNLGRHKIQVSVPDLQFSDGQSCGFGGISFNLDLL